MVMNKSKKVAVKVRKLKAWLLIDYLGDMEVHFSKFGVAPDESLYPCTITYEVPKITKKKRG